MADENPFRKFTPEEIKQKLSLLSGDDLKQSALDAETNAKYYLEAAEQLLQKEFFKAAQVLSSIALEEIAKSMALLDLREKIKTSADVAGFFFSHKFKYKEVYRQEKYSRQRVLLNQQARYLSFTDDNKRPAIYANEGFESLALNEIEDVKEGLRVLDQRLRE